MSAIWCPQRGHWVSAVAKSHHHQEPICLDCHFELQHAAPTEGLRVENGSCSSSERERLLGRLLNVSVGEPVESDSRTVPANGHWPGEEIVTARARALRVPLPLGRYGRCVLPGHGGHKAGAKQNPAGTWGYWCPRLHEWFTFAQVRAVIAYANIPLAPEKEAKLRWPGLRLPGRIEVSRWAELLDHEAGMLQPRDVRLWLPDDLTDDERRVWEAIRLMLSLRDSRWEGEPFTWARRMNRARTGLSDDRARAGLDGLRRRRVFVSLPEKARGGALRYRLGLLLDVLGSEDAIVQAFIDELDAELLTPHGDDR